MRSSANRTSPLRRVAATIAVALAIVAWFGAVFVWTTANRVTTASGFTGVTTETLQSPDGTASATAALLAAVDRFADATGYDLTASSREQISDGISEAISGADFPGLMGPAIERAREAYDAAPDGPITIDFAPLRPLAVAKVQQVRPDLVKAIPPDADLTVTVEKQDVPGVVSTIAGASDTLSWLPLWLLLGAALLGVIAVVASGNRPRMLRILGIASLVIAIVPIVLRLAVPPAVSSLVDAGHGALVSTATTAVLGHWWISLIACVALGVVLIVAGRYAGRRQLPRRAPVILGR